MKMRLLILLPLQFTLIGSLGAAELNVIFKPASPTMHLKSTAKVGDVTVYDHSKFSVTLKNRHRKPISVQSVQFISIGDVEKSGLGDIINYWPWRGSRTIQPGKAITFDKVWGFTVDTPNSTMTYRFEVNYNILGKLENKQIVKELVLQPDS